VVVVIIVITNNYIAVVPTNFVKDLDSKPHWVRYNVYAGKRTK